MILQTGMRTDIPAFYAEWFANRIKEGYVWVRNPFNPKLITEYKIHPDVVDAIGFCSKNPRGMFPYLDLLKPYGQYWFVTITPYGKDIEPYVPDYHEVIQDVQKLSNMVGVQSVGWRYDPVFLTNVYTKEKHIQVFEEMCTLLSGYTHTCVISFLDLYEKVQYQFPQGKAVSTDDQYALMKEFVKIASRYNIQVKTCCEGEWLKEVGADVHGCITQQTWEKALGSPLQLPKEKSPRQQCACVFGHDIGVYSSCLHMCRYCYANGTQQEVIENYRKHDPHSPLLIGHKEEGDTLHIAKQVSNRKIQISLFDDLLL